MNNEAGIQPPAGAAAPLAARPAAFKAAAVGSAVVDGTSVERVRIQNGIVDVTLGIDAASGRVHSLEFTGRK